MNKIWIAATLITVGAGGTNVFAHGDAEHSKTPSARQAVEETQIGRAGNPAKATRTVAVSMSDQMRFDPAFGLAGHCSSCFPLDVCNGVSCGFIVNGIMQCVANGPF